MKESSNISLNETFKIYRKNDKNLDNLFKKKKKNTWILFNDRAYNFRLCYEDEY